MASTSNAKVRLVKCPKCLRLLPELADLLVYECGGCGTFLQAKIRSNNLKTTTPDLPERDILHSSEQENVDKDQESSSTIQNVNILSADKCLLDKTLKNHHDEPDTGKLVALNIPSEATPSACAESSVMTGKNPEADENETSSFKLESSSSSINALVDSIVNGFELEGSTDIIDITDGINHSTEPIDITDGINHSTKPSDTIGVMPKFPSTKSAYAYDGSISSCDETDDQVPNPHLDDVQQILRKGKYPIHNNRMRNLDKPSKDDLRMSLDDDGESPTVPFYLKKPCFENGSPSSHWHDEFKINSTFCSPNYPEDKEKLKLLRMVCDLQDQLDKTHIAREQTKQNHKQYNHEACFDEVHHSLWYPCPCTRRCRLGEIWPTQSRFSGEAINKSHQVHNYYLHFGPHGCQCAVQCDSPNCCYNRVHLGHNLCSAHNSCPSTFEEMHFSKQSCHARSNHHFVKRHLRPMADGAPFVTCYNCLQPLQLPVDFLPIKRKCHRLRCGACSKVFQFSFQRNNHSFPDETGHTTKRRSSDHRNASSSTSFKPVESRKKRVPLEQSINKYKKTVNKYERGGASSSGFNEENGSSEKQKPATKTDSSLKGPKL